MGFLQIKDIRVKSFVVALITMSTVSAFGIVHDHLQQLPGAEKLLTEGAEKIMDEGPVERVLVWVIILGTCLGLLAVITMWRFVSKQMVQTQSAKYDKIIEKQDLQSVRQDKIIDLLGEIKAELKK